ncbi:MAG: uroporphyrinogen-III synthase [Hyphomonas sp.]
MTKAQVIITRALPGAADTASRLLEEGYTPLLSPALELIRIPVPNFDDSDFPQIIFTSANGVRFFCDASSNRNKIAWCVGPSTARAARNAGFTDVREGAGNGEQLAALILADPDSATTPLLHVANDAAAGKIVRTLNANDRKATFAALYTTRTASCLPSTTTDAMSGASRIIVLIHSAKGATAFSELIEGKSLANCIIVAISDVAVTPLKGKGASAIIIAATPNEDALFQALDTACLSL